MKLKNWAVVGMYSGSGGDSSATNLLVPLRGRLDVRVDCHLKNCVLELLRQFQNRIVQAAPFLRDLPLCRVFFTAYSQEFKLRTIDNY